MVNVLTKFNKSCVKWNRLEAMTQNYARNMSTSPLTQLSDEEQAMKDIVTKLAVDKIQPLVKEMDEKNMLDKSVIKALFDNGVRL
jgi:hypothetical protein